VSQVKKCKLCQETFTDIFELENHLKTHKVAETFVCDNCDKTFVLNWRLRKTVHETDKYCHYFNNNKTCPFEDLTEHDEKIHEAEKKSEEYSKFLKEQQLKMKNMTPTELFNLVEVIKNRNP
jgi:hypothetical protein